MKNKYAIREQLLTNLMECNTLTNALIETNQNLGGIISNRMFHGKKGMCREMLAEAQEINMEIKEILIKHLKKQTGWKEKRK